MVYNGSKLIKQLRTKMLIEWNITLRQAAKKMGISFATLSRIENGSRPDVDTLATVCYFISLPIQDAFIPVKSKSKKN